MENLEAAPAVEETAEREDAPKIQEVRVVDEAEQQQRSKDELRAKLKATFERLSKDNKPDGDDDTARVEKKADPERDETGKFKPKALKESNLPAEKAEAKPAAKAVEKPQEEPKAEAQKKPKAEPPGHWPDTVKKRWTEVPEDLQSELSEAGLKDRQTLTRLGNFAKNMDPIAQVIDEHADLFKAKNLPPRDGIEQLLKAQRALDENPVKGLLGIAEAYGVNPQQLAQAIMGGHQAPQSDPELLAMKQELASLRQQLADKDTRDQQSRFNSAAGLIEKFAAENPDFESVAEDMILNIPTLKAARPNASEAEILQEAYERAVWTNPKTRQQRLDAETAARLKTEQEAADKSRRASALNVEGVLSDGGPTDLKQILRRKAKAFYGD